MKISMKKPISTYVALALMDLQKGEEVVLKGIGKTISKVVDVAEVIKRRIDGVNVKSINIDTINHNGKNKSYIEIIISRNA